MGGLPVAPFIIIKGCLNALILTFSIFQKMINNNLILENEKQAVIDIAEEQFGRDFFDKLDKMMQDYLDEEETLDYSLTTNYEGAFYAYAE
ncbi:MAG: hypothetical protein J6T86_04510 [Bacteroidales bacterium]|nr:hypothetical protein [Bacteroidales bacterium]